VTYAEREESVYEGNPIELYQFEREDGIAWRYTSSDESRIYLGNFYTAIPMQRNAIEVSQDTIKATLKIEMPVDEDFIQQFVTEPPFIAIAVTVWRYHEDNTEVVGLWTGRVINIEIQESTATVLCESSYTSLKRNTLRRVYSVRCPHLLYGPVCKVDKNFFVENVTVASFSGTQVTSTGFDLTPEQYFLGGYVEHTKNGFLSRRFVIDQVDDTITLELPLYNLEIGDVLVSYPGCSHTLTICNTKFSNVANYGGQPWIPDKNPLGGVPIF
jgi:uncharacterized phage protein (TIGR02218 family)